MSVMNIKLGFVLKIYVRISMFKDFQGRQVVGILVQGFFFYLSRVRQIFLRGLEMGLGGGKGFFLWGMVGEEVLVFF